MSLPLSSITIRHERDVVLARQRARQIAEMLGFDRQDQTRIATAVSEIARNAFRYAEGGRVEFGVEGRTPPQVLLVRVQDRGRGIAALERVLSGQYRSATGMGLGILGAKRLVDRFNVETGPTGTTVVLGKLLPRGAPLVGAVESGRLAEELASHKARDPVEEVQRQNQELLATLDELRRRQEELTVLNQELEDTNRGVVALYAELDEKADHLRRADELKSRFLSNMSHEFRTPLNSIVGLTNILLSRVDGALTEEQETQGRFILKAAKELTELVDDLLDLAKVEAGKIVVRPAEFDVRSLFGALRGMLRPLLLDHHVTLVFEEPELPPLYTDEQKVSQVLRNFISNALKFTERGEVRVTAGRRPAQNADGIEQAVFTVADTGIGIAAADRERIFQEFSQVEHPIQKRVRGTGLGLPLSRRLAELLGGHIELESEVGRGSTFALVVPMIYRPAVEELRETPGELATRLDPERLPVLVVEDMPTDRLIYEKYLKDTRYQPLMAPNLRRAREWLVQVRPAAAILDILLRGEDTWKFLTELKADAHTSNIPVLVVTTVEDEAKALALGAEGFARKPLQRSWLIRQLDQIFARRAQGRRALVIDDDEASRYRLRRCLEQAGCLVTEAAGGEAGLRQALAEQPDIIFLDLVMPDLAGGQVLARLQRDERTRSAPVVIVSSLPAGAAERADLASAAAVLAKRDVTVEAIRDLVGAHAGQTAAPPARKT